MEVKVGKAYKTRGGHKVELEVFMDGYASTEWVNGVVRVYQKDGTHGGKYIENEPELDIVSLWRDETPTTYTRILEAIAGPENTQLAKDILEALNAQ